MSATTSPTASAAAPSSLASEGCQPCRGGKGGLSPEQVSALLPEVRAWHLEDERWLARRVMFRDFREAMAFLNRLADVAEAEGHHPDFTVSYRTVDLRLTTHDVGGLSRNDFILAAKLDGLVAGTPAGGLSG